MVLSISMVLITSQLLSPNFSSSKYTISQMKHDQSTLSPFIPVKPTHPTTLICFYLINLIKIDEMSYSQFISIIVIIGNQWNNGNNGNNGAPHHCLWTLYQYICSDYDGVLSLFCLWIAVRYRLSWAWRTCPPSYCLSYFLFKIYMKNGNAKTVFINILFYPVVVLLSIRWLSICICVKIVSGVSLKND